MMWLPCLLLGLMACILWKLLRPRWRRCLGDEDLVLVTGCDSGIGLLIVKTLLRDTQATVCAGCITDEGLRQASSLGPRVLARKLDVTQDSDVQQVFEYIAKSGKTLRGVVNNAGIGCYGWCEGLELECFQRILDVNLVGAIRVTKAALPLLRQSKGRLVAMSSVAGRVPSGFGSGYAPTKAALSSFQSCVRQEVFRFGVHCSVVEPGFFATGMLARSAAAGKGSCVAAALQEESDISKAYGGSYEKRMAAIEGSVRAVEFLNGGAGGVRHVAAAVLDALTTVCPKSHYLVGVDANVFGRLGPMIPCWIIDYAHTFLV